MQRKLVAGVAIAALLFFERRAWAASTGGAPQVYTGPVDNSLYRQEGYHDPVYTENDTAPVVYDISMDDVQQSEPNQRQPYHDPVYTENDSLLPIVGTMYLVDITGDLQDGRSNPEVDIVTEFQRVNAFLYVLRACEHDFPVDDAQRYQTFFGNKPFQDMSDHPVNTREKAGVRLSPQTCRNAGISSGICVSTAAGAYQFVVGTWNNLRKREPYLPTFEPIYQDEAAIRLLKEIGAYPKIVAGDFSGAVVLAGKRWASLPGAIGKQGQRTPAFVAARYSEGIEIAQTQFGNAMG